MDAELYDMRDERTTEGDGDHEEEVAPPSDVDTRPVFGGTDTTNEHYEQLLADRLNEQHTSRDYISMNKVPG
jgi:hypothetical protein